jgi:hypothetical protein
MVYTKTINDSMIINFDYVYHYLLSRINVLTRLWNNLVVLPNKFAFEENKLINLGRVVSMTVFLYFVNSLKCLLFRIIIHF